MRRLLDDVREITEPSPREVAKMLEELEGEEVVPLLKGIGAPTSDEIRAVRLGVHARRDRRRARWILPVAGLGAAAAAGAIVLSMATAPPARPDVPLAMQLESDSPTTVSASDDVHFVADGYGEVSGTSLAPRIAWESGRVEVSVTPKAGIDLQVKTLEATVRVVGTVFEVDRGALGTEVSVTRGAVETTCVDGTHTILRGGESLLCVPVEPAGLLNRARALRDAGAHQAVVEAAKAGLASAERETRAELLAVRATALRELGDRDAAAADAGVYLQEGHTLRRRAMETLIEELPTE
jgi:ferric-dicitrate binding protein FerR (iron transport regulator)